MSGNLG
ncbi:unnamed protein product, partial [Didymodactylos carnosus]